MRGRDRVPRRRPGSEGGHRVQTMGITRSFNLLTGRGPGMARRRAPRTGKVGPGGPRWGRSERIRSMTGLALAFRLCPSPRGPIHHTHGATWRPFLGQPVGGVRRIVTASARCIAVHCSYGAPQAPKGVTAPGVNLHRDGAPVGRRGASRRGADLSLPPAPGRLQVGFGGRTRMASGLLRAGPYRRAPNKKAVPAARHVPARGG